MRVCKKLFLVKGAVGFVAWGPLFLFLFLSGQVRESLLGVRSTSAVWRAGRVPVCGGGTVSKRLCCCALCATRSLYVSRLRVGDVVAEKGKV